MYGLFAQISLAHKYRIGNLLNLTLFVIHRFMWEPGLQFQNFNACKNPRYQLHHAWWLMIIWFSKTIFSPCSLAFSSVFETTRRVKKHQKNEEEVEQ